MSLSRIGSASSPLFRDETLAAAVGLVSLVGCVVDGLSAVESAAVVLLALPLAWRTRHPTGVLVVIAAGVLAYLGLATATPAVQWPLLVALYTVAAHGTRGRTLLVAVATLPVAIVVALRVMSERSDTPGLVAQMSQYGFVLALGEAVRSHRVLVGALRERAARAEHDRELEAQRRVNEERVRITRDVHDVVAHNIATISTQASVGLHVGRTEPERALEFLESIKSVSALALRDLRHALGAIREGGSQDVHPTPSLRELPRLVQRLRDSGTTVRLETQGSVDGLPAALDAAAYRIVQEALTNVMRHADGAAAIIRLVIGNDEVEVLVIDDGRGSPTAASTAGTGSGLDGMRARVEAFGGAFEAGQAPGQGFRVRALLPLGRESA